MAVSTGTGKLHLAMKTMRLKWEDAKAHWNDSVRRAFEENYIEPMEKQFITTLRQIDLYALALHKAQQDCGENV
jgi:hypothetical protein